jgi:transaldolase
VLAFQGDATNAEQMQQWVQQVHDKFGRIDILVNNAGGSGQLSFDEVDEARWQEDVSVKLFAPLRMIRLVLPYMKAQKSGSIINLTMAAAATPGANQLPTVVSRQAGATLAKALSKELGPHNIRVNVVCVGARREAQQPDRRGTFRAQREVGAAAAHGRAGRHGQRHHLPGLGCGRLHHRHLRERGRRPVRRAVAAMKPTRSLHDLGQSLWLDNITRDLLDNGTLAHYIVELSVTGLTSNPTIFAGAIGGSRAYDAGIETKAKAGLGNEALFVELALEDLRRAADLFEPVFERTAGVDGWVSMYVSPLLASDTAGTIAAALHIHRQADRPNLFVKIPGTPEGLPAIEEAIFAGVPVNVTLLFSCAQYEAAAEAWLRGIERRIDAGLDPRVDSVASLFISRWDAAVAGKVPAALNNRLGIAVGQQAYVAYRGLLASPRLQRVMAAGARPQRLLWASTGTKDPAAPDTLYIEALAAPDTVNTMPEKTLLAFADHGKVARAIADSIDGEPAATLAAITAAGIDPDALALKLQQDGAAAFVKSWHELLGTIDARIKALV